MPRLELETRVVLVMHYRERAKATATGPLALACLPNSELVVHGRADAPLDLTRLGSQGRRVLVLFPVEGARPLSRALAQEDPRPITLVVPDGNWRQARRIPRRVPGLADAECVGLPAGPPSAWGVRHEPVAGGLATFEAIARALGAMESEPAQARMEDVFQQVVRATFAARGQPVPTPVPALGAPKAVPQGARSTRHPSARPGTEVDAPEEGALPVVYRDSTMVVVNKPAGVPSHHGWVRDVRPALQRVRDQLGQPVFPVHRLDRATSGLLVFALTSEMARDLQQVFADPATHKRYLALCRGCSPELTGVDHPLAREPGGPKREAVTELRLLGGFERYGLYEATPRTGRTHQIRRHLKHASHPIIGDVRYGKGEHNRVFRTRFDFHRLALHCHRIRFQHPRTGGAVACEAPVDGSFARLLTATGLTEKVPRGTGSDAMTETAPPERPPMGIHSEAFSTD